MPCTTRSQFKHSHKTRAILHPSRIREFLEERTAKIRELNRSERCAPSEFKKRDFVRVFVGEDAGNVACLIAIDNEEGILKLTMTRGDFKTGDIRIVPLAHLERIGCM